MLSTALAAALVMATGSAPQFIDPRAESVQKEARKASSLEAMPRHYLATIESAPGDDIEAIMVKAAIVLTKFTTQHRVEGCGILGVSGDQYVIRLTTSGAAAHCLMNDEDVPIGFKPSQLTIHSHPTERRLEATPADRRIRALLDGGGSRRPSVALWATNPDTFSPADRAAGPGFLVADGKLLELTAGNRVRHVTTIEDPK